MKPFRTSLYRLAFLLPLAAALSATGCVPGLTWLPDSSGFVYTTKKGELRLCEAATGKTRLVAKRFGGIWPGVSPNGKRFASVELKRVDTRGVGFEAKYKTMIRVAVYNRDGKVLHQTPFLEWGPERLQGFYHHNIGKGIQVFWSRPDVILLSGDHTAGRYDLKTKKLKRYPGAILSVFGVSPVRPDGKGFLLLKPGKEKQMRLQLVDWQGNAKTIGGVTANMSTKDKKVQGLINVVAVPTIFNSNWQGNTAVVSWSGKALRIDTKKRVASWQEFKTKKTAGGETIQYEYRFPNTKVTVRLVQVTPRAKSSKTLKGATVRVLVDPTAMDTYRIEAVSAGAGKPKVLARKTRWVRAFPSPDGNFVAFRYAVEKAKTGESEKILLVNSAGAEVTNLVSRL